MPDRTPSRRKYARDANYAALGIGGRVQRSERKDHRRGGKKALRCRAAQLACLKPSTLVNTTAIPPRSTTGVPPTASAIKWADHPLNLFNIKLGQREACQSKFTAVHTTSQATISQAEDLPNRHSLELQPNYNHNPTSPRVSPTPYSLASTPYQAPSYFSPYTIHQTTHLPPSSKHHRHHPLTIPIHPLFSPHNFPTLLPTHHALIRPALLLASRFLTSPLTFAWWLPLLHTSPTANPPLPHPDNKGATYLAPVPDTLENRVSAYVRLRRHARDVTFRFRDEGGRAWASTHRLWGGGVVDEGEEKKKKKVVVFLDRRFEAFITDELAEADDDDSANNNHNNVNSGSVRKAQHLRFHLLLAINLVHEIAHTLCSTYPEPYHSLSSSSELGSAWEAHVFAGGKIQAVGFDVGCRWGLMWFPWLEEEEGKLWGKEDEGRGRFWGVDMRWVEGMFEERVWGVMEREGGMDRKKGVGVRVVGEGVREPFYCFGGW
ncbi:MAG: hypothetical protein Q9208_003858 [Pyrenodesmia sp. 3 TL-2023]